MWTGDLSAVSVCGSRKFEADRKNIWISLPPKFRLNDAVVAESAGIVDESVLDQEPLTFGAEASMVARHRDRGARGG